MNRGQEISISPAGTLRLRPSDVELPVQLEHVLDLIGGGEQAAALFELSAIGDQIRLPPGFQFWRDFSSAYMKARCAQVGLLEGESLPTLAALEITSAARIIESAPFMFGIEFLSVELLQSAWRELDEWLLNQVSGGSRKLIAFLTQRAPRWHASGQVYFHLAENKADPELPFAFMATWLPQDHNGAGRHQPLAKALTRFAGPKSRGKLRDLLEPVVLAARSSELVASMVERKEIYTPQAWPQSVAYQFLQQVPLLQQSGVIVRLPDWWAKRPKPQMQATLNAPSASALDSSKLLQFSVSAVLDGEPLSAEEWQQLMEAQSGLVLLKGRWVEVDSDQLSEAMEQMKVLEGLAKNGEFSFFDGMRLLAGVGHSLSDSVVASESEQWRLVRADDNLGKLINRIRHPETLRTALPGKQLKADLRPYQKTGVRWLWQLNQLGLGACLADDMGLGKTIQVISLMLLLKNNNARSPNLLVLPTSLLGNWQLEIGKFAPSLTCCFVHSSLSSKEEIAEWAASGIPPGVDLVLTSYGTLLRQMWLADLQWGTVVLDEAQAIKNAGAKQSKAVKTLRSANRIALTGTPVENHLSDLWSLFDFINPGLLGNFTKFKRFVKALEQRDSEQYTPLRKLVQPYILRRLKTDKSVISDLPDKTEVQAWCGLSAQQASLYQQSVNELVHSLKSLEGMKRRGLILAFILRFKQICNHPAQFLSLDSFPERDSGKFQRLAELAREISERQEKVLVFTQFRSMCDPLAKVLAAVFMQQGVVLHGGTAPRNRQKIVRDFQDENGPPFLVLSLKAGGTGLNLTSASHVIHFDRWWNPAVENQATDRAFRIGQKRNVLVHKFVCRGTIEEKIDTLIRDKSAMAAGVLSEAGDEAPLLTELGDSELIELVSLDLDQVQTDLE